MGEEHRINEIKGVIISRALLKEYGYDGDMPTDKQMQVIGNGLLEYWGVSDGFKEALASTMENMFGVKAKLGLWKRKNLLPTSVVLFYAASAAGLH